MTLELQVQEDRPSREQRIRAVFESHGRMMTIRSLARACVDAGIWTTEELDRIAVRHVQAECRNALKERDSAGIPKHGQTTETDDDGQRVWKARQLWMFEDYTLNVREYFEQRDENHVIGVKLAAEGSLRYGQAIDVPSLPDA